MSLCPYVLEPLWPWALMSLRPSICPLIISCTFCVRSYVEFRTRGLQMCFCHLGGCNKAIQLVIIWEGLINFIKLWNVLFYCILFVYKIQNITEQRVLIRIKFNLSLYTLYYAEACYEFAGTIFASLREQRQHSTFRRNIAAMARRWQHCVQFDWPENWTSDLPLQRRTDLPVVF